ncbi:FAST kinase domain-containing protein 3, mitochondrial isoform X2 [Tenrec ecaudatus]
MALVALRRGLSRGCLSAVTSRPLSAEAAKKPRLCWRDSSSVRAFHAEQGNAPWPGSQPVASSRAQDSNGPAATAGHAEQQKGPRTWGVELSPELELPPCAPGALQHIWEDSALGTPSGQFDQETPRLTNAELLRALQAQARLGVDPPTGVLGTLVAECQHRLRQGTLAAQELCVVGESLAELRGPGSALLQQIGRQLQGMELADLSLENVVAIYGLLQACPDLVDQHPALLGRLNAIALTIVPRLGPKALSQLLGTLVALDQAQALPLVIRLGRHAIRHLQRFTGQELGFVLEAFIHFGHHDQFFTQALEQHVAVRRLALSPEVLCRVTEYCGRKRILSEPVLAAAAESFVCQADRLSPHQVAALLAPLGQLNYSPPNAPALFGKLESTLQERFCDFPPRTLLGLLHSCSLVGRHPVNFMARIFSPYFLQQLQGTESRLDRLSLAQLTQLFLSAVLECPFYKGPKLLPKYQVKSFLTPCCSLETPVDFPLYKLVMAGLIDLLGARHYFASKVLTPYGYTIDVEIRFDEEGFVLPGPVAEDVHKRVALCIDGPRRFCSNSKNLLGKEATKQRHLRLLGYEVVQIPCHEVEMLRSRPELVDYLQSKLFSQGRESH